MLLPQLLALTLALAPAFVSAALFPKDTLVKQIDAKGFKKMLKENATSMVAFTAPWCGHCQRLAPEFSKAALGLHPLVPFYNVDCDNQKNKKLCAEQGIQGFPTIKMFPRGSVAKPILYEHTERTSSAFYYWTQRNLPHGVTKVYHFEDLPAWVDENKDRDRALLVNYGKGIPLLWQVLSNKYKDHITFGVHRDRHGKSSVAMGFEEPKKGSSKVLIYPKGSTEYVLYEGIQKHDSLSKFFDSIIDGTADLRAANEEAKQEEFVPDEAELEIERQQEAQRMALAHGGFSDLSGFEDAVKDAIKSGQGADYHSKHGYAGTMGDELPKQGKNEDPIHNILKAQKAAQEESAKAPKMAKTGDAGQVVFEAASETGHARTPAAASTPAADPESETGTFIPSPESARQTGAAAGSEEASRPKDEL